MCTTPCGTCFFSFFLNVFFLPFFSGVAAPETSTGFAMLSVSQFLKLLNCGLLLVRDRALARTLAGARIGVGTLSPDRQIAAMTRAAVRADLDEALDVHGGVLAQVAFHVAFRLDDLADAVDLVFIEVLNLLDRLNLGRFQNLGGARVADAVDVGQRDVGVLVAGQVDARNSSHDALYLR